MLKDNESSLVQSKVISEENDRLWTLELKELRAKFALEQSQIPKKIINVFKGEDFDYTVPLGQNFYLFSNGGWMKRNPIPPDFPSWNTFSVLRSINSKQLRSILDNLRKTTNVLSEMEMKLCDCYSSYMDTNHINSLGIQPMIAIFKLCSEVMESPEEVIAKLHAEYGIHVFFNVRSSPDKSNSDHSICSMYQGEETTPDRDWDCYEILYQDTFYAEDIIATRDVYVEYIYTLFLLIGEKGIPPFQDKEYCKVAAMQIFDFKVKLTYAQMTRTAYRDPDLTYNRMNIETLVSLTKPTITWPMYLTKGSHVKEFDWRKYFCLIGKSPDELGNINVAMVDSIKNFPNLLQDPRLPNYLIFQSLDSYAMHLSSDFVHAHFNFHERELKGTILQRPRWNGAIQVIEEVLGDALGQLYVEKHYCKDTHDKAEKIVSAVRDALYERLNEVTWMSPPTKLHAIKKLDLLRIKIGHPTTWTDYEKLNIIDGEHFMNIVRSRRFEFQLELDRMNKPTDRSRWFMTPQTVNAYYHPSMNEMVIPAAILQPPFFEPKSDAAVQFGSLGAVVGHELTHGFDDHGRKYDAYGNLRDWWAANDGPEYKKRAMKMIMQAEAYEVYGIKLNGQLTNGENIADLGGVKLALRALDKQLYENNQQYDLIGGFLPHQRFFLAWSLSWRENVNKERAIQLVTLDPHSPNEFRCNGPLSNIEEFHKAFSVFEFEMMYRSKEDRVDIW
eukprot:gene9015-12158_t